MPILPDTPDQLHRQRQVAESFGEDPARYDRARPSYPAALVERIVAASPGRDVLDVGIGTGIVARLLRAAECTVLGVEVDERMAEFARQGGTDVEVSAIEVWDSAGRTFDAVVAGQSWHWVDPVAGGAKAAEVLRAGGLFVAFWNVHRPSPAAAAAFAEIYERVAPELPTLRPGFDAVQAYRGFCDKVGEGLRATEGAFGEPEIWQFEWDRTYTRDEWLDVVPTHGGHSLIPQKQRNALFAALGVAIDELGGGFDVHYTTVAVAATRLPPAAIRFPSSPARGEPDAASVKNVPGATGKVRDHTPEG
jgi:SAM-dependent methyltransferase